MGLMEDNSVALKTQGGHPGILSRRVHRGLSTGARMQGSPSNLGDLVVSGRGARTAEQSEKQSGAGRRGVGVPQ